MSSCVLLTKTLNYAMIEKLHDKESHSKAFLETIESLGVCPCKKGRVFFRVPVVVLKRKEK